MFSLYVPSFVPENFSCFILSHTFYHQKNINPPPLMVQFSRWKVLRQVVSQVISHNLFFVKVFVIMMERASGNEICFKGQMSVVK